MFKRTQKGVQINWTPTRLALAKQAMEDVDGTGVTDGATLADGDNVHIDSEVASNVRHRYMTLALSEDIDSLLTNDEGDKSEKLKKQFQNHTGMDWDEWDGELTY